MTARMNLDTGWKFYCHVSSRTGWMIATVMLVLRNECIIKNFIQITGIVTT